MWLVKAKKSQNVQLLLIDIFSFSFKHSEVKLPFSYKKNGLSVG